MSDAGGPIVVPPAELAAVVRHADVPSEPPDELLPYVRPAVRDGATEDWLLTEDTLAFADVAIPLAFERWRAAWERSWLLDPLSSLERLVSASRHFEVSAPSTTLLERVLGPGTTGPRGDVVHAVLAPGEATRLAGVLESLRDAIADRGRTGFGFIDATPGRQRVGLVRSWSGQDGPEILVADRRVVMSIDPELGLSVMVADDTLADEGARRIEGVTEVEIRGDHVYVTSPGGDLTLDLHTGRVLGWWMPGCSRWRVRRVPEVLVWARTFAGIVECADYATAIGRPVLLTSLRLSDADADALSQATQKPRRLESSCDQEH